jgi:hypothetical protein
MSHFNAGWPWERDYLIGRRILVPLMKLWVFDYRRTMVR